MDGQVPFPARIAVVIPSFRVTRHILPLIRAIGPEVSRIFVVDDACPDHSGDLVERECRDPRVRVLRNSTNLGVGGAVMAGYRAASEEGFDCVLKVDGDGQMDPSLIRTFAGPILAGVADYTKGNRFYHVVDVVAMPAIRIVGNAVLSFITKLSSGYWHIFDPTNGYTAISGALAACLPYEKISRRYFFESDMLFRIGLLDAVVMDIPMTAIYRDEVSGLKIGRILTGFLWGHMRNLAKRVFYQYFLRDFSIASVELVFGIFALVFGLVFGVRAWGESLHSGHVATAGTVMLAALPVIVGTQSILSWLNYDIRAHPQGAYPISARLGSQTFGMPPAAVRALRSPTEVPVSGLLGSSGEAHRTPSTDPR